VRNSGAYPTSRVRREMFRKDEKKHTIADGIMSSILVISITSLSLVTYSLIMNFL
jgi:hypothetical protein